jgi:hypothetical protein
MSRTDLTVIFIEFNIILICDSSYVDSSDGTTIFGVSRDYSKVQ